MHLLKMLLVAFVSCGLHAEKGTIESISTGQYGEQIVTYITKDGNMYDFIYNSHKLHKEITMVLGGENQVITWGFID